MASKKASKREQDLALSLLEIVPPLMGLIRFELQASTEDLLSLPQYRILSNILRGFKHMSQIAENHGVSQPAMSKMVEQLAGRGLLKRVALAGDRRLVTLAVTTKGETLFRSVRSKAQARLLLRLDGMDSKTVTGLVNALGDLEDAFLEKAPPTNMKNQVKVKATRTLRRIQK